MAFKFFGFEFGKPQDLGTPVIDPAVSLSNKGPESFVPPETYDGTYTFETGGVFGTYVDIGGQNLAQQMKGENELIRTYRGMSLYPEVDQAIEDIVNESVVPGDNMDTVKLDLDDVNISDIVKKKIHAEFKKIKKLLSIDKRAHDMFRRWYIDSKLYYHILIDNKNPDAGMVEVRPIDPLKIKRIRKVNKKSKKDFSTTAGAVEIPLVAGVEEYYLYTNTDKDSPYQTPSSGIKISPDSIAYCSSGLIDGNTRRVIGYLHKAIRSLNMLRQTEDAVVIYRISRAPERRVFYIDVGNLPKNKAEQYLREIMNRYRNKLIYDQDTGQVRDDRNHLSMLEDYWLPRREGGRGTEITTLPGGDKMSQLEDVEYLLKKVYRSLNVPVSRMESENGFNMGRSAEISRDEVKFQKFITRLQVKFSELFYSLLRVQLILKGITTEDDWNDISQDMKFRFNRDTYFDELKENEIMSERINMLNTIQPLIGTFFTEDYIKKHILKMSDQEIRDLQDSFDQQPVQQEQQIPQEPTE
tara:strand:- start:1350 stop:2924 length:1575 start_codon:yes stop_codon:yes gene_type:complete